MQDDQTPDDSKTPEEEAFPTVLLDPKSVGPAGPLDRPLMDGEGVSIGAERRRLEQMSEEGEGGKT